MKPFYNNKNYFSSFKALTMIYTLWFSLVVVARELNTRI